MARGRLSLTLMMLVVVQFGFILRLISGRKMDSTPTATDHVRRTEPVLAPHRPPPPVEPSVQSVRSHDRTPNLDPYETAAHNNTVYLLSKFRRMARDLKTSVLRLRLAHEQSAPNPELAQAQASRTSREIDTLYRTVVTAEDALSRCPKSGLRIATVNLWNLTPSWPARRKKLAQLLATIRPDVVAVQEVRFDGDENQLTQLASEHPLSSHGYRNFYSAVGPANPGREEGLGILISPALGHFHRQCSPPPVVVRGFNNQSI
eukprot:NODE_1131_length_1877_cov_114.164766_g1072_i0.p1 GENE.NODE_1131_length_1877_cov_114.164766_g1072_i0~~NODE_1131_length_1877_cov_114.164766_g1072_i0.p1  ORF type:complete len:261 (-),score=22.93 NODE_1131_length_1877_cov_114.164766_g1072_i0:1007-1789(-)